MAAQSILQLERYFQTALESSAPRSAELLRDAYRGVLVGLAVGNCLGLPVEGLPRAEVLRRYPDGLRDISPLERERPWDDDLAQAVILSEALLAEGRLDLGGLASRLQQWARENGRGMGRLTSEVLEALAAGTAAEDAARVVWERSGRMAAGNGAVMRCAPVALRWRTSASRLIEDSRTSAIVSHYDPRCLWSTITFNVALALSISGAPLDLQGLAYALRTDGAPAEVAEAVLAADGSTLESLELDGPGMGYTLKAMQVGLWALQREPRFEEVLAEVVSAGGDTDTNGAVAGAAVGGRAGLAGIPDRWRQCIRDLDTLLALADRLLVS